jgi:uncharacterized protein (DUF433 family)
MPTIVPSHIEINDQGRAVIAGTRFKVYLIARLVNAGWTAERIHTDFPHLTLGQIYAAIGFYYDHRAEMDALIADLDRRAEESRIANEPLQKVRVEEMRRRWHEMKDADHS